MTEYFMPISELSKKLDIPAHTLRFWEKEFSSLIVPITGAGGRRYYRPETVENIFVLKKHLYAEGYTIDGVKKLIQSGQFNAGTKAIDAPAPKIEVPKEPDGGLDEAARLLEQAKNILT